MSTPSSRPPKQADPEKNWEDEYKRLREENIALKQLCNEQEDHIRRLLAKIRKIENDFAALSGPGSASTGGQVRNREEEDLITTLYAQVKDLKTKNTKLTKDNEKLTEQYERKKREVSILNKGKKVSAASTAANTRRDSPDRPTSANASLRRPKSSALTESKDIDIKAASARRSQDTAPLRGSSNGPVVAGGLSTAASAAFRDEGLMQITQQLQNRLNNTEELLIRAKEENAALRQRLAQKESVGGNVNLSSGGSTDAQVRDLTVRLQILQTQYDHMAAKTGNQKGSSQKAEDELESYAQKVRDLRRALEDLRYEKELSDIKAGRVKEQEETIAELRESNRNLEDKISRLCQTPFIGEAFGNQEAQYRFEDVTRERNDLQTKIDHLQEAVRTHYSALVTLRQQAAKLREEKEEAEKQAESMRNQQQELKNGHNLLQDKLRLYSGEDGVSIEDLERALTVVKRRGEAVHSRLDFLEDPDAVLDGDGHRIGADSASYLPLLKRKSQELQVLNLNLTREVERLESMLKLQSGINRDLHKELEQLVAHRDKDKAEILKRAESFEELAMRRQEKIFALESQIRQYIYGMVKRSKGAKGNISDARIQDVAVSADFGSDVAEQALLSDLLEDAGGEIQPDDNLMEVWIKEATVRDNVLTPGCSTFIVTDFFDYESQSTGLVSGNHPKYDFATTFKIKVDDFLLRHLATDVISFELNMACQGDFTMLARCTAPLSALLRSKPVVRLVNHPLVSVKTSEVVANITVEIRLALPLSELYRLFLERHPQERRLIEDISNKRIIENNNIVEKNKLLGGNALVAASAAGAREDESRMFNELEVTIVAADGLPSSSDSKPPSPYVLFQLLGHPDKFTNIVENTNSPAFNERFYFPMITNDATLRLLRRSQLLLSVLDMREEELFDTNRAKKSDAELNGILGESSVSLAALSDGAPINDFFTIRNADNKNIGRLRVTLKWKNPFRKPRDLGPRALSDIEIETLVSGFGAGIGNEGGVDYRAFVRFADPPSAVSSAISRLRAYSQRLSDKEGLSHREIFTTVLEHKNGKDAASKGVREDSFIAAMIGLEVDVLPAEYSQLFRFIDLDSVGTVNVDQLIAILNLDEVAGIPETLQDKLKTRVRDLESRDVSVLKLFERADNWGVKGVVTRLEFKTVLCQMGFQLPDDPSGPLLDMRVKREGGSAADSSRGRDSYDGNIGDDGDVLQPSSGRRKTEKSADGGNQLSSEAQRQREIFQQKLNEIQARTREAANNPAVRESSETISPRGIAAGKHTAAEGVNLLDRNSRGTPRGHKTGVHASTPTAMSYDTAAINQSAVKVQSIFRGHSARKQIYGQDKPVDNVGGGSPTRTRPPLNARGREAARNSSGREGKSTSADAHPAASPVAGLSILQAEDILRASLVEMQQTSGPVNLINSFVTLDGKRRGFVNRQQFAMALRQHKALAISPEALRAFMDYFDSSQNGADIDYNAFVIFANYKPLDPLPTSKLVNNMVTSRESMDIFRSLDANGTGYLKRQEMLRGLAEIGYGHLSQTQSLAVMALFETDIEGHVNFGNFVEFCMSSPMGRTYAELEKSFINIIGSRGQADDGNLQRWFRKIDNAGTGSIDARSMSLFLDQFDVRVPKAAVTALCRSIALVSNGSLSGEIGLQEFATWFKRKVSSSSEISGVFSRLSLSELQKKAASYLLAMALHRDGSLNDISQSFQVYDWKKPSTGVIGRDEFFNAALRAGFLFTPNELNTIATEFSSHGGVLYRKFLAWATPMAPSAALDTHSANDQRESVQSAGSIAKLLQRGLRKGIDLLSVFGRYDTTGVGRITCDEFCAALSDLGWSAVSRKEATDFADRFRAAAGNLIMYRRIVTELLRQIDDQTDPSKSGSHGMGDITDIVAAKLTKEGVDIRRLRDLFEYYDRKNIGHIRIEDLPIVFEEAKVPLRRYELDAVTDKFSGRRSVGGDYEGYIQYPVLINALQLKIGSDAFGRMSRTSATRVAGQSVSADLGAKIAGYLETVIMLGKDFRSLFDAHDTKFAGAINVPSFKSVLVDDLNWDLGEVELEALCKKYRDRDDPRMVSHVRMIRELHPRLYSGSAGAGDLDLTDNTAAEIAEALRLKVRRRYDYTSPGELRSPFQHFAGGADIEMVTLEDFSLGLRKLEIRVAADQEKAVFDSINIDHGRGFNYPHFVTFVCDPQFADVIWKLRRLMARNHVSNDEVIDTITATDMNASGLITTRQFLKAMKTCRLDLSESDISRLLLRFDIEGNQRFDVDEFIFFLKGSSGGAVKRDRESEFSAPATVESTENRSLNALKKGVQKKLDAGYTAAEIFALFDPNDKRAVDLASLQEGARELGVAINRVEARGILRRMSVLAGGTVDRGSFFATLDINAGHRSRRSRDGSQYPDEYDDTRRGRGGVDDVRGSKDVDAKKARELLKSLKSDLMAKNSGGRGSVAKDLLLILDNADGDNDGKVSSHEFLRALETMNTQHTRKELALIFDYCAATDSASNRGVRADGPFLSTSAFIEMLFDADDFRGASRGRGSRSRSPEDKRKGKRVIDDDDMKRAAEKVFTKRPDLMDAVLAQLVVAKEKGSSLRDFVLACEDFDMDRSGFVRKSDFVKALQRAALTLKSGVERDLVDSLDDAFTDASGGRLSKGLHYPSFATAVENDLRAEDEADEVLAKLRRNFSRTMKEGTEIEDIFNSMDRDRSGRISIDEFEDGLRKLGLSVSREESKRIASKFSSLGGSINYREFVKAFLPHRGSAADTEFIEAMIKRIRNTLMDRMGSHSLGKRQMKKVFEEIDVDGDGSLSIRELKDAMAMLKVDVTSGDIEQIVSYFDPKENGRLRFVNFLSLIGSPPGEDEAPKASQKVPSADLENLVRSMRRTIEDSLGSRSARAIKEAFADIDRDGSGRISPRELRAAMSVLKVDMTSREAELVFQEYDADRDGTIDYKEFMNLIGYKPDISSTTSSSGRRGGGPSADLKNLVDSMRRTIEDSLGSRSARAIKEAFADIDRDGSGRISPRELRAAMSVLKVDMTSREAELVFQEYDADRDGTIDYKEFMNLIGYKPDISSSSSSRRY